MHVTIHTAALDGAEVSITNEAADAVRLGFTPSADEQVEIIKALGAALLSACDPVVLGGAREIAIARTNIEQAVMWAVKGATTAPR